MLPRHLSRPFTMMARRVQSASHSSMLGRQGRLQQGGTEGQCQGPQLGQAGSRAPQAIPWVLWPRHQGWEKATERVPDSLCSPCPC